jgi:hypothetical protein
MHYARTGVMDLSTGGDIEGIRKAIVGATPPVERSITPLRA